MSQQVLRWPLLVIGLALILAATMAFGVERSAIAQTETPVPPPTDTPVPPPTDTPVPPPTDTPVPPDPTATVGPTATVDGGEPTATVAVTETPAPVEPTATPPGATGADQPIPTEPSLVAFVNPGTCDGLDATTTDTIGELDGEDEDDQALDDDAETVGFPDAREVLSAQAILDVTLEDLAEDAPYNSIAVFDQSTGGNVLVACGEIGGEIEDHTLVVALVAQNSGFYGLAILEAGDEDNGILEVDDDDADDEGIAGDLDDEVLDEDQTRVTVYLFDAFAGTDGAGGQTPLDTGAAPTATPRPPTETPVDQVTPTVDAGETATVDVTAEVTVDVTEEATEEATEEPTTEPEGTETPDA